MSSKDIIMTIISYNPSLILPLLAWNSPQGRAGARVVVLRQRRLREPAQGGGGVVVVDPGIIVVTKVFGTFLIRNSGLFGI